MANCEERGIEDIFKKIIPGGSYNRSSAEIVVTFECRAIYHKWIFLRGRVQLTTKTSR